MYKYWRVFIFFSLGLISLGFYGCNNTGLENLDGSSSLGSVSLIQGSVKANNPSFSTSLATSTIETTINQEDFVALNLALITDSGIVLQKKSFATKTSDNSYKFSFEGNFQNETLRLVIYANDQALEVALGTVLENVLDIEISDYERLALATRYLEQTSNYASLKAESYLKIRQNLDKLALRLANEDISSLISNYHRLGVNQYGNLVVMDSDYSPKLYKEPKEKQIWEELYLTDLSFKLTTKTGIIPPSSSPKSEESTQEAPVVEVPSVETSRPDIYIRQNLLTRVTLLGEDNLESSLYVPNQVVNGYKELTRKTQTIRLHFKEPIDEALEMALYNVNLNFISKSAQQVSLYALQPSVAERYIDLEINPSQLDLFDKVAIILQKENIIKQDYLFFRLQLDFQ